MTTEIRSEFRFFVRGNPKGQPRTKARAFGKHARVYTPGTADDWKSCVRAAAKAEGLSDRLFSEPLMLHLFFFMPRPKAHFKGGDFARPLKENAPSRFTGKPDADNLAKAVMDALTDCGAWRDDALVCDLYVTKRYGTDRIGCEITTGEAK